jgi:hypothetical protein
MQQGPVRIRLVDIRAEIRLGVAADLTRTTTLSRVVCLTWLTRRASFRRAVDGPSFVI